MTTTAWAHLPNAALIDAVLADVKARPDVWEIAWQAAQVAAQGAVRDSIWAAAWRAAWGVVRDEAQGVALDEAWDAGRSVARRAAGDVIHALATWDDCAYLLDLPSTTLLTMLDLCDAPACHQALLVLAYVLVKEAGQ